MPFYEYRCGACEHDFEVLIRTAGDEDGVRCPQCGGGGVERRLSVFAARQGSASSPGGGPSPETCGRCGESPGSCPYAS